MNFYSDIIQIIKKEKPTKQKLSRLKLELCKRYKLKKIPTDIEILLNVKKEDLKEIKRYLITKPTRTISGVSVIAVMSKPYKCPHGKCNICPGGIDSAFGNVPQSYTGKEPATRRAIRNNYDPYLQVMNRLEQYVVQGHLPDKIELIVMGGTFPSYPKIYRDHFIMYCFKAMNDFSRVFFRDNKLDIEKFKEFFELPADINEKKRQRRLRRKLFKLKTEKKSDLPTEQNRNESSKVRCVGLTLETRPDYAMQKNAEDMLRLGATRVELGVQTIHDDILKNIDRGHTVGQSIEATKILKDLGFKINYHMMPGLPGSDYKKDLDSLNTLFADEDFRPDMLKLYPCMVLKGTKLYEEWRKGKFKPLTTEKAASLIADFKKNVPEYVRIMRVQRDIPTFMTEAGVDKTNLRQYIEKETKKRNIRCRCIRCREIGRRKDNIKDYNIRVMEYDASEGKEFFIQAEKGESLIGFCRLRFPSKHLRKEIVEGSALIRELHVYGSAVQIGKKGKIQHSGIGKKLLKKAETIAKSSGYNKMIVISGVGVKNYYRRLGYKKQDHYMIRKLNS